MALEDFFTLSEMKDGLGTIARVEELISVMERQKDCSVNNLDAARQWCTVARILVATQEDCLLHFIRLNGLFFLNHWLQEAQKINNDTNDCSADELIDLLLAALEKLPVTHDNLNSSGVAVTVEQIQGCENSTAQNRARKLIAKWKNVNVACGDPKESLGCHDYVIENDRNMELGNAKQTALVTDGDVTSSKGRVDEVGSSAKSIEVGSFEMDSRNSIDPCTVNIRKDVEIAIENQQKSNSSSSSERETVQEDVNILPSAVRSDKASQDFSIYSAAKAPDSGIICSTISIERDVDNQTDHRLKEPTSSVLEDMEVEKHSEDLCEANDNVSGVNLSSVATKDVDKSLISDQECLDTREDAEDIEQQVKTAELSKSLRSSGVKSESSDTTIHQKEYRETSEATEDIDVSFLQVGKRGNSKVHRGFSRSIGANSSMEIHKNTSELTLGYGDDALDFAVQVAIEAKREVADRERLSSSPESKSDLDSSSSKLDGKSEQSNLSKSTSKLDDSDGESSMSKKNSRTVKMDDSKASAQKMDSPKTTFEIMEPRGDKDKNGCGFDLNDDAFAEEPAPPYSIPSNLSAPRAVIAMSKGPTCIPVAPLHFEGELGWRGSAATSAFRPASPRRTPDSEKNVSISKRTSNFLDFDLNVAEVEEDAVVDPVLEKQIPDSSDLPSRDSSIEVSSRRTEKLKLDLNNSLGDEEPCGYQSTHWPHHHQNGNASASSASFSSSRQQTMRDIDLNDNPSFVDQCGSQNLNRSSKDSSTFEAHKLDDPGINIMGSRMPVVEERKEPGNQTQSFLSNGLIMGSTSGRPPMFYTPMPGPAYGYNNLAMSPNMPLPPGIYGTGSIPYMVDSRGTTVIPQVLGPPVGLNGVPPSRPPFFVSLAGVPQGFPTVGAPRPNLDLNAGMICLDGNGNREVGGFRPICMPGYTSGLSEEQMRASSHSGSGSVIGLKRKESDLAWDPYPVDHKKVTSWK